jgi:hypothetical protein
MRSTPSGQAALHGASDKEGHIETAELETLQIMGKIDSNLLLTYIVYGLDVL